MPVNNSINLTPSVGGVVWSTATAFFTTAGTATAGQMLQSGNLATPTWSTATYPSVATSANTFLIANGTNWVASTSTLILGGNFEMSGGFTFTGTITGNTAVTFPTSGTLATTAQIPTGAALTRVDDTNVTLTLGGSPSTALVNAASLTLGWTGQLGLTRGGSGASLVASNGGIIYSDAAAFAVLAGTATAGQILRSGASSAPSWSTATYPATAGTSGNVLASDGTNFASTTAAAALPAGTLFNLQQAQFTAVTSVTSTSPTFADFGTNITVSITPTSASNNVLVRISLSAGMGTTSVAYFRLVRDSTVIGVGNSVGSRIQATTGDRAAAPASVQPVVFEWLDSPATTSATAYKVQACTADGTILYLGRSNTDTDTNLFARTASTITVMEVKV